MGVLLKKNTFFDAYPLFFMWVVSKKQQKIVYF